MKINIKNIIFLSLAAIFVFATNVCVNACHHDDHSIHDENVHSELDSSPEKHSEHCEKCIIHFPSQKFLSLNDKINFNKIFTSSNQIFTIPLENIFRNRTTWRIYSRNKRIFEYLTIISSVVLIL